MYVQSCTKTVKPFTPVINADKKQAGERTAILIIIEIQFQVFQTVFQ
jgi:hypothetical protein